MNKLVIILVSFNLLMMPSIFRAYTIRNFMRKAPNSIRFASITEHGSIQAKKYIVVTGGVISGIGKGVSASSIGILLKMLKLRPTAIKIDPYLNVDAGTMSPFEHGEVFVLDDGTETDLDLGNYERFLDVKLSNDSNITTGKIYQSVIAKERRGDYLGKTVQIIPHITNEIIERIKAVSVQPVDESNTEPEVCVIELGGTIGDIESMPFVEAIRQLQLRIESKNLCIVHVSMVPVQGENNEHKTKPTQHSIKELRALGLAPDFIICRSKIDVRREALEKISLFCNVPVENVLSMPDVSNIYHVPLVMLQQNLHNLLIDRLGLNVKQTFKTSELTEHSNSAAISPANDTPTRESFSYLNSPYIDQSFLSAWTEMTKSIDEAEDDVRIALVGKYTNSQDAYLSVISAIKHSCIATKQKLHLEMIESTDLESSVLDVSPDAYHSAWKKLKQAHGIVVPGGFGIRGIEGKVQAIHFARTSKVPFLGVCLGMQAAVIEYARHELNRPLANSREFAPEVSEADAAVIFMPEGDKDKLGGTMRLGSRRTILAANSLAASLYNDQTHIDERHRHRYEVNPSLINDLSAAGLVFSGKDEKRERMEVIELDTSKHPYFVGVQFHPEFKSRPQRPAPVFLGLLQSIKRLKSKQL